MLGLLNKQRPARQGQQAPPLIPLLRPARQQMRQHRVAAVERRHQRAADFRVDLRRLEFGERPHPDRAADAIDQHVDAAERVDRARHRRARAVVRLEIRDEAGRVAAARFGRDLGHEIRAIDEQHLAALGRRAQRDAAADALRRAGHHDDLSGESLHGHAAFAVTFGVNFS